MKYLSVLFLSSTALVGQDLAPDSIAYHMANFYDTTIRPIVSPPNFGFTNAQRTALFTADQSISLSSNGAPLSTPRSYTWTKTGPTSGILRETDGRVTSSYALSFTDPFTASSFLSVTGQSGASVAIVRRFNITFAPIPQPAPPLVNLSTLATLVAGQVLNTGFVVGGAVPRRVLIRAVGPSLATFGVTSVMADPVLTVFRGLTQVAANNDWGGTPALAAAFSAVGAFALPVSSTDAALLLTATPGNYTAQITGTGPGDVIVELYFVD